MSSAQKVRGRAILVAGILVLLVAGYFGIKQSIEPRHCPPTEKFFGGVKYNIEICISSDTERGYDYVRLRVYSAGRILVAQRRFVFLREMERVNELNYEDFGITYTDARDTEDHALPEIHTLKMPPTWLDWLSANINRLLLDP